MGLFTPYSFLQQKVAEAAPSSPYAFRTDAYASYVKLAIPGMLFTDLGMSNYYDDVHADIAGSGTNYSANITGSVFSDVSASIAQAKWPAEDYTTSAYAQDSGCWGTVNASTELGFGTNDWVIESWVYLTEAFTKPPFWKVLLREVGYNITAEFGNGTTTSTSARMRVVTNGGNQYYSSNFTFSLNTWYHVAFSKTSSTLEMYWNGTRVFNSGITYSGAGGITRIMNGENATNDGLQGYYQDLRVTVGSNRGYTGATITTPQSIVEKL